MNEYINDPFMSTAWTVQFSLFQHYFCCWYITAASKAPPGWIPIWLSTGRPLPPHTSSPSPPYIHNTSCPHPHMHSSLFFIFSLILVAESSAPECDLGLDPRTFVYKEKSLSLSFSSSEQNLLHGRLKSLEMSLMKDGLHGNKVVITY